MDDVESLVRGRANHTEASKLGVSRMDLEDFIKGSTSAAMAKRLGLTIEASDELAGLGGGSGATGILLGLLLP